MPSIVHDHEPGRCTASEENNLSISQISIDLDAFRDKKVDHTAQSPTYSNSNGSEDDDEDDDTPMHTSKRSSKPGTIEQCKDGVKYKKTVQVRREDEAPAMCRHRRKVKEVKNLFRSIYNGMVNLAAGDIDSESEGEEQEEQKVKPSIASSKKRRSNKIVKSAGKTTAVQYSLKSHAAVPASVLDRCMSCLGYKTFDNHVPWSERVVTSYFSWTFRTSFAFILLSALTMFFVNTLAFAGLFYALSYYNPQCIEPPFYRGKSGFVDLFTLSWTTFSTVGYGHIYPDPASDGDYSPACAFVYFLTSMEAFIGVLYAGLCSAILFAKVLRTQSQAQVFFSDIIALQYGDTLKKEVDESFNTVSKSEIKIPCPTLEFQVANRLYNVDGGEILEASLKVMAIFYHKNSKAPNIFTKDFRPDITYSKLDIDVSEHPHFKYIWKVKHELNENSPLLTRKAKRLVHKNGGFWPQSLNTHDRIHRSIRFEKIILNLSGISNFSASTVLAQKTYHQIDLYVGYKFVNMFYQDEQNSAWKIDFSIINDVIEQDGGRGEPLVDALERKSE